ncbi:target of Myb1 membrane trafficking protein [Aplochiton taeniatus]
MEFLTGNPFSTPVGQRIEHATSSSLQLEDWALNMEICDIINATDEGPKDAIKAIKKRISGNKNFREVMLTLTVLEACVKNCGHKFHVLVSTRDFVEGVLVRAIIPKNNPPLVLHDKVLSIIQAWADAFRSTPDLTGVVFVYEDLRRKGLEFPMTELDGYSPIHTPDRSVPGNGPSAVTVSAATLVPKPSPVLQVQPQLHSHPPPQNQGGPILFTPYQIKKLKEDLGVVQGNLMLMSDMMSQLDPVSTTSTDAELLQELYSVCKNMQDKIVELVPRLSEEKLIEELLAANDDINTTFNRYQRYERRKTNGQNPTQKSPSYVNLIDLNPADKSVHKLEVAAMANHNYVSQSAVESLSSQMSRLKSGEADDPDKLVQKRSLPPTELLQRYGICTTKAQQQTQWHQSLCLAKAAKVFNLFQKELLRTPDCKTPDRTFCFPFCSFSPRVCHVTLCLYIKDDIAVSTHRSSSPQFEWLVERGMIPVSQTSVMDDIEKWLDVDAEDDDVADSEGVTSEEFDRFLAERVKAAERLPSLKASSQDTNSSCP